MKRAPNRKKREELGGSLKISYFINTGSIPQQISCFDKLEFAVSKEFPATYSRDYSNFFAFEYINIVFYLYTEWCAMKKMFQDHVFYQNW